MSRAAGPEKKRVVIYLDPATRKKLRREHADTDKPVSEIAGDILREHYARRERSAASA